MKFKLISLALICLLIFPNISYAADLNNENITENGATEAVITDENGNKISIPIEVYEPVKEIGNSPMMLDGLTDSDVEKYHQDFSVTIDKEAVENAVARAGGEYSDTTYDGSYTIKLWGRLYFDKKISLDINGEPQDTYRIIQMEGHFKNIQPDRMSVLSRKVIVACTNNFNDASGQHVTWYPSIPTFNNMTNFKYYAFANQPFAAIGGTMTCAVRTVSGQAYDVTLPMALGGTNILPGI